MSLAIPPWVPPAFYWNLIQLIAGLTATFTAAKSPLRLPAAATTALLAYLLTTNFQTHFAATRPSGPIVAMCWVNVLNAFDLLLSSRASYDAQLAYTKSKNEKKDKPSSKDSLAKKLFYALILPYNLRRINSPWQITRLPRFSASDPSYVPSRTKFLLQSLFKLAISGLLMHFLTVEPTDPYLVPALARLSETKSILLLRDYDLSSILLQARFSLSFGIITRAAIVGGYTSGAAIAVLLGSDPAEWPPIAGSLTGAWSLGRLWGQTWHQILRRPLSSTATSLSSLFGLSPSSPWTHRIRVITAFLGSGLIHALMDLAFGVPWEKSGAILFFGLQIFGLAIESVFMRVFGPVINRVNAKGGAPVWLLTGLGYIWVLGFLFWGAPVWINPILVSLARDGTRVMSPWLGLKPGSF
ncbi:membrane bound O-acyl transferase family-domain-containing protein [Aspergillus unguis]